MRLVVTDIAPEERPPLQPGWNSGSTITEIKYGNSELIRAIAKFSQIQAGSSIVNGLFRNVLSMDGMSGAGFGRGSTAESSFVPIYHPKTSQCGHICHPTRPNFEEYSKTHLAALLYVADTGCHGTEEPDPEEKSRKEVARWSHLI